MHFGGYTASIKLVYHLLNMHSKPMLFDRQLYLKRVDNKRKNFQTDILFEFSREIIDSKLELLDQIYKFTPTSILEVGPNTEFVDDEALSLKNDSYDCIISNMSFHFVNDVESVLSKYLHALKKNGFLIMTFFGEENLIELKNYFMQLELEVSNGMSPRFIPNITVKDAGRILQNTGFKSAISSVDTLAVNYKSMLEAVSHLRSIAQTNCLHMRNKAYVGKAFYNKIKDHPQTYSANYNVMSLLGMK